ncbi:hypothetical protein OIU84_015866 [Salix udensis]|uniref:Uncharacterized protein n=1 Tax=Salix udensis TaxID=889485 RepID=A0AAD6NPJ0_9ROSI|nr:hypothetical protein OIU84_015866 [Salix udensis]
MKSELNSQFRDLSPTSKKKKKKKRKKCGTYLSILICKGVVGVAVIWRRCQGRRVARHAMVFCFCFGVHVYKG